MGKKIIVKGADFSNVCVGRANINSHFVFDLKPYTGNHFMESGATPESPKRITNTASFTGSELIDVSAFQGKKMRLTFFKYKNSIDGVTAEGYLFCNVFFNENNEAISVIQCGVDVENHSRAYADEIIIDVPNDAVTFSAAYVVDSKRAAWDIPPFNCEIITE